MNNRSNSGGAGIGLLDLILVVNIVLKLVGVIQWSWWVVLWPLWVGLGIIAIFLIIVKFIWKL